MKRLDPRHKSAELHSIFERSLHEHARSLVTWTTGLCALVVVETALFPTIRDNPSLSKLHNAYPQALRSLFGITDLTTGRGFLRAEVFSFVAPILVIIVALLWGSDLIAGEEDRRTIDLLLANPISRRRVLLEKWAALVVGVATVCIGIGAGLAVGVPAFRLRVAADQLVAAVVATALLGVLFGSLALAISAASGNRAISRGITALLAIISYLLSSLSEFVGWLRPYRIASPWYHALGIDPLRVGLSIGHLGIVLLIGPILVLMSARFFNKRDLAV